MPRTDNADPRTNIADELKTQTTAQPGELYQRFRAYFDILLSPENPRRIGLDFSNSYVNVPSIENALAEHLSSATGQFIVLSGNRGIGKTTILRMTTTNLSVPEVRDNCIYIPFLLDSNTISSSNDIRYISDITMSMIASQLDAAFHVLQDFNDGFVFEEERFFSFVKTHAPRLLYDLQLKRTASNPERIEYFKQKKPYAYFAEMIKFASTYSKINKITLIVDNIEHVDANIQCMLVEQLMILRNCFYNTSDSDLNYTVNLLVTCRPETVEMLQQAGRIRGWIPPKKVSIKLPVDLDQILVRRFEDAIDAIGKGKKGVGGNLNSVTDPESWKHAYEELIKILTAMSDRHGQIVVELANYDLRQAMDFLLSALKNSRWYYRGSRSPEGSFDVRESDYRFSYAGFFRALVLRDRNIYEGSDNEVIGNLLHNTFDDPGADLMCAYIGLYMQRRGLRRALAVDQISSALLVGFDKSIVDRCLEDRLRSMVRSGLIYPDRVTYEPQYRNQEGFLATERLNALLEGVRRSSLFLEFMRDDFWASRSVIGEVVATSHIEGRAKFFATIRMIERICLIEKSLIDRASKNGLGLDFDRAFGPRRFSAMCLEGLSASLKKYYYSHETGKASIPAQIKSKLSELRGQMRLLSLEQ